MNYDALKAEILVLREKIINDTKLKENEREDLKAAVLLLIMYINHRKADGP